MAVLTTICVLYIAFCVFAYFAIKKHKNKKIDKRAILLVLAVFFVLRIFIAKLTEGHSDIDSFFYPWSHKLSNGGFFNFYLSDVEAGTIERLNDYPPMYMYPLALIGWIVKLFDISKEGWFFMMRTPAIVMDIVCGYYILKLGILITNKKEDNKIDSEEIREKITYKNMGSHVTLMPFLCMLLYLANPAVITDSSWWGQVDGITAFFIVLTIYKMYEKKDLQVVVVAIVALAFKLQYIFILPAVGMYYLVRLSTEKMPLFKELMKGAGIGAIIFFAINLPLSIMPMIKGNPFFILEIYVNQVANYGYYTMNAANLYGALGLNYIELPEISSSLFTLGLVTVVSGIVALIYMKKKDISYVSILSGLTIITMFMFSFKMHERYMFYAIVPFLITFMERGKGRDMFIYGGFTLVQFVTIGMIMSMKERTFGYNDKRLQIISIICLTIYIVYVILMFLAEVSAGERRRIKCQTDSKEKL